MRWLPRPASRGQGRAHRLFHPLCGATPDTLVRLLLKGGIDTAHAHVMTIACAMAVLRAPFTLAEAGVYAVRPSVPMPAPIFIVGHWRSGTTHLTNILSRSPAFGMLSPLSVGLPCEALSLARVARPFIEQFFPRDRLIDGMALRHDQPQEDELALANLSTLSCNHGFYFPGRLTAEFERGVFGIGVAAVEQARWARRLVAYIGKMTRHAGRPLLIRNPVNSARIPLLRALWPEARFIHIHRDPFEVCASSARVFAVLLRELALSRVDDPQARAVGLVRQVYPRLMAALAQAEADLPPDRSAVVRYEAFRRAPMAELERLHDELGLPGFGAAQERFAAALRASADHTPSRADASTPELAWLHEHPGIFARWGYRRSRSSGTSGLSASGIA